MWRDPREAAAFAVEADRVREFGEALSTVEGMALGWGHDVNNPLAIVVANLEILADLVEDAVKVLGERSPPTPREATWLDSVEVCLRDAQEGARRIQAVTSQMIITGNEATLRSEALVLAVSGVADDAEE